MYSLFYVKCSVSTFGLRGMEDQGAGGGISSSSGRGSVLRADNGPVEPRKGVFLARRWGALRR